MPKLTPLQHNILIAWTHRPGTPFPKWDIGDYAEMARAYNFLLGNDYMVKSNRNSWRYDLTDKGRDALRIEPCQ